MRILGVENMEKIGWSEIKANFTDSISLLCV